jgi:hypothetical protein
MQQAQRVSAGAITRTAGFSLDEPNEMVSIINMKIKYKIINCKGKLQYDVHTEQIDVLNALEKRKKY